MVSEFEKVLPIISKLAKKGCLKEPVVSEEFGEMVLAGEQEVLLSGVLPGRIWKQIPAAYSIITFRRELSV